MSQNAGRLPRRTADDLAWQRRPLGPEWRIGLIRNRRQPLVTTFNIFSKKPYGKLLNLPAKII
ncbi:hypothetical protein [Methylomonas koyamae]|uniref:hypothetical protein n=1 Tax=Methylomonas koyamae TaxID=702114 RepID=UPI00112A40C6|nr:hypothetical protein [Methylomonas koyamae]